MSASARIALALSLAALIVAVALWWSGGAWQYGALPTRGLVRVRRIVFDFIIRIM